MKSDFLLAITQLSAEKNLPKDVVLSAVESALASAYKKEDFAANQNIAVKINPNTSKVEVYVEKTVVEKPSDKGIEMTLAEAKKINPDAKIGDAVMVESTPANGLPINARGAVGSDGTFVLSTFGDGDGAVVGKHRVLVRAQRQKFDDIEGNWDFIPEPVIHPRFESYENSGLEFTVAEGDNEFRVVVQRPPAARNDR